MMRLLKILKNIDTMKRIANNKGLEEKVKFIKIEENNLDEYIEKWSNHQIKIIKFRKKCLII